MFSRSSVGLVRVLLCAAALTLIPAAAAQASVVEHGYLPLKDGTMLNYTLTLPSSQGRFPVVLEYGPYDEGVTSDPTWNDSGYAMLGVSFRGTGCSQGALHMVRADIWGADGAQVVDWAARQAWSDGNIGMLGFSFTGTSQIAKAATDPTCDANEAQQLVPNDGQTGDTTLHPFRDDYWGHDPASLFSRI